MTRVLVVHHDIDMADQVADSLRREGFDVDQCSGPTRGPCPVLNRHPCSWVERADVLLYDVWATGDSEDGRRLVEELRTVHPEIPLVLMAPGMELDWVETEGPYRVTPLVGLPTHDRLAEAIRRAQAGAGSPA